MTADSPEDSGTAARIAVLLMQSGDRTASVGDHMDMLAELDAADRAAGWMRVRVDDALFLGSVSLLDALFQTYIEHIGITESEGPDGPYIWCACEWRSDTLGSHNPGYSYAVHLSNALHEAAVKALQPSVIRRAALLEDQ